MQEISLGEILFDNTPGLGYFVEGEDRDQYPDYAEFLAQPERQQESPPLLFDERHYLQELQSRNLDGPGEGTGVFSHWLIVGVANEIVPTALFDEAFYQQSNPDVNVEGMWGFHHFLHFGAREKRAPLESLCDATGVTSAELVMHGSADYFDYFRGTCTFGNTDLKANPQFLAFLRGTFYEPFVEPQLSTDADETDSIWQQYLDEGIATGIPTTPLFEPCYYTQQVAQIMPWRRIEQLRPFHSWLALGWPINVPFTQLYEESYYLDTNRDLVGAKRWTFEHFARHGAFENRRCVKAFAPAYYLTNQDLPRKTPALLHYLVEGEDVPFHPSCITANIPNRAKYATPLHAASAFERQRVNQFSRDPLRAVLERAEALEPGINNNAASRDLLFPCVWHPENRMFAYTKAARTRLPAPSYEAVVVIPHCRMSGATRIGGCLAQALTRELGADNVLVIRTDGPEFEFPEWFGSDFATVDLSDLIEEVPPGHKERLLLDVLRGVNPRYAFNVNSRTMWQLLRDFGQQLAAEIKLFSYFFCWDRNQDGKLTGYPGEFFSSTFDYLTGVLVDSNYLKADLVKRHCIPPHLASRIHFLRTPNTDVCQDYNQARQRKQAVTGGREPPPRIFWAGRFDRQKRVDLLVAIANAMPEARFWVWGKPVIDSSIPFEFPENVSILDPFRKFEEVPVEGADCWLYTAEWDGIPTILLEIGATGTPIVASQAEGVGDLITDETGWPIQDIDDVATYVNAIRTLLSNRDLAQAKAERLQEFIVRNHSASAYSDSVKQAMRQS